VREGEEGMKKGGYQREGYEGKRKRNL